MIGYNPPHALLRPGIAIPFLLLALIWGSTWLVIKDQLAPAPPAWSVAWRFMIAAAGMYIVALVSGQGFRMTLSGHVLAVIIGLTQFSINFNLVYEAEIRLTSGIVAVLFGLLLVPNAILSRIFLGHPITPRFVFGSAIGMGGIAMLLMHEARRADLSGTVSAGVMLAALAILSVSISNVLQASDTAKSRPLYTLLAWSMLWGAIANLVYAFVAGGPPAIPASPRYWAGVAYLAVMGSVVTFPLYFKLIRELGAGRAAYNGVVVPVVAMTLSTLFEDYRWSLLAAGGAALALVGMVVALRSRQVPPPMPESNPLNPSR
jgi:drug/metabolite transporter (DMT)-like permease